MRALLQAQVNPEAESGGVGREEQVGKLAKDPDSLRREVEEMKGNVMLNSRVVVLRRRRQQERSNYWESCGPDSNERESLNVTPAIHFIFLIYKKEQP